MEHWVNLLLRSRLSIKCSENGFSYGNAGGTGSINTEAEVQTQQALSWDQLMARLMASASASGLGSAQSNLDLGTGSDDQSEN